MKSFVPIIMIGLRAPEYSLRDALNVAKGVQFTHRYLAYDVDSAPTLPLMDEIPEISVPTFFFTGRRDMTSPASCTERYYTQLVAPSKRMIWFEHSAHFAFLEEPVRFNEELMEVAHATEQSQRR